MIDKKPRIEEPMNGPDLLPVYENWCFSLYLGGVAAIVIWIIVHWPWQVTP